MRSNGYTQEAPEQVRTGGDAAIEPEAGRRLLTGQHGGVAGFMEGVLDQMTAAKNERSAPPRFGDRMGTKLV